MIRDAKPLPPVAPNPSAIQGGDLVMRRKKGWLGYHYGTAIDGGVIAHTTPVPGKHIGTPNEFADGLPVFIKRRASTPLESYLIQQRALEDLGRPYLPAVANCEHDVTRVHGGTPYSPMLQSVLIGLSIGALLGAVKFSKELGLR